MSWGKSLKKNSEQGADFQEANFKRYMVLTLYKIKLLLERHSTALIIKSVWIKTTMRNHLTQVRMAIIRKIFEK